MAALVGGQVIDHQGDDEQDHRAHKYRGKYELIAKFVDIRRTEYGNERRRSSGRVHRPDDLQYRDRCRDRQRPSQTYVMSQQLVSGHPYERRHDLADDEIARLSELGVGSAIEQRCRGTERSDEKEFRRERQTRVEAGDRN